ncbi:MAG: rhodanese-like domain-containing protein [Geitlerinemataceae cyanobacterium]
MKKRTVRQRFWAIAVALSLLATTIAVAAFGMPNAIVTLTSEVSSVAAIPEIAATDLKAALDCDPDGILLLDVRNPDEFAIGHIEGAQLIPVSELREKLDAVRDELGDRRLVVYCKLGVRGARAVQIFDDAGIAATNLQGGIDTWSREVDPSIPRY